MFLRGDTPCRGKNREIGTETPRGDAISYTAFWISSAILLLSFLLSIYVVIPTNVLSSPTMEKLRPELSSIWPQGWGFFTKNPDSPNLDAYREAGPDEYESLLVTPQGLPATCSASLAHLGRRGRRSL